MLRIPLPLLLALVTVRGQGARATGRKILVIESYHAEVQWDRDYCRAIKERFAGRNSLTFFEMNTKHLPPPEHPKMAELAWKKYLEVQPGLGAGHTDPQRYLAGPAGPHL